jgi:hypothetical protein
VKHKRSIQLFDIKTAHAMSSQLESNGKIGKVHEQTVNLVFGKYGVVYPKSIGYFRLTIS